MSQLNHPIAEKRPHKIKFGKVENENRGENIEKLINPPIELDDPYFWLRDDTRKNPEVLKWLETENEYFKSKFENLVPLSEEIYKEHIHHLKETDISVPISDGEYVYY